MTVSPYGVATAGTTISEKQSTDINRGGDPEKVAPLARGDSELTSFTLSTRSVALLRARRCLDDSKLYNVQDAPRPSRARTRPKLCILSTVSGAFVLAREEAAREGLYIVKALSWRRYTYARGDASSRLNSWDFLEALKGGNQSKRAPIWRWFPRRFPAPTREGQSKLPPRFPLRFPHLGPVKPGNRRGSMALRCRFVAGSMPER
jgi:hypothetical protein